MLIFVDDYFNCLTVGTVMRPVTDKHKITRAKLAYIIDATAAPICIIAPISSWAAAVGSSLPEDSGVDGFSLFLHTIPFNLYALLTICFMLFLVAGDFDFAAMKRYEEQVKKTGKETTVEAEAMEISGNGKVIDLILPILVLIAFCVSGMLYTGGILDGVGLVEAFANCDSALSLVLGSFFTLVFIFAFYMIRRVIRFNEFCESFTIGVKAMIPAIMILCLAWTLSGICSADYLNIGGYVKEVVGGNALVGSLMPALMFVIAAGLAFSTGIQIIKVHRSNLKHLSGSFAVGSRDGFDSGRCGLRRPCFPDLGYDHPCVGWRPVPPHQPRIDPDPVCAVRSGVLFPRLSGGRNYRQWLGGNRRGIRSADCGSGYSGSKE